jgi:GT2 family glycosyltransferase
VIPVLNASSTLPACLDAIQRAALGSRVELLIVDNGSTDGSPELVTRIAPAARVIGNVTATVAALRNIGVEHTHGSLIAFIDSDCVVDPDYFSLARKVLHDSRAGAVGSTYALPDSPGWIERVWFAMHEGPPDGPVRWLYGGNMVVRRELFDAVGGFEESLETGEDVEFCHRLALAGSRVIHDRRVRVVHLGNPRTLAGFARQQRWHGIGMLQAARLLGGSRPLLMTLAHVALSIGAPLAAWGAGGSPGPILVAVVLAQLVAPTATVFLRFAQSGRVINPPAALLLYWIYFWARAAALVGKGPRRWSARR